MEKRHRRTHFGEHPQSGLSCRRSALALCPALYKFIGGATPRFPPALPHAATGWIAFRVGPGGQALEVGCCA